MKVVKVSGKNKEHKVSMYTISTCAWCNLAKNFLKDKGFEYEYVDVDLCNEEEKGKIRRDIQRRGGKPSYPTIIIDNKNLITGFHKDKIMEALGS